MRRSLAALGRRVRSDRGRPLVLLGLVVAVSVAAGWAVYMQERKPLGLLALFTLVVLLRRWSFPDLYVLALAALGLSHVHIAFIQAEFATYKWLGLFALGGVSLAVALARLPEKPWPRPTHFLAGAFVLFAAYSVTWSTRPNLTFGKAGVFGVGLIIAFVGAWAYAMDTERVRRVVNAQVLVTWGVFALSVPLIFLPFPGKTLAGRFRSIFENPNALGVWTSQTVPLLFAFALDDPSPRRRLACRILLACAVLVAYASGSRGGVGGAMIGGALYMLARRPSRTVAAFGLGALVLAFLLLYRVPFGWLGETTEHLVRAKSLSTLSDRTVVWDAAKLISAERPVFGHGFGQGNALFGDYGFEAVPGAMAFSVHSTYLEMTMNLGIAGLVFLLVTIGAGVLSGAWAWWRDRHGEAGLLALAVTTSVIASTAHGVVEQIFLSMGNPWSLPFWVSIALLVRLRVIVNAKRAAEARARRALLERDRRLIPTGPGAWAGGATARGLERT